MTNVTVQEALKAAIEAFELHAKQYPHMVKGYCIDALEDCKAALSEIEKCEPVAYRVERHDDNGEFISISLCTTKEQAYETARYGYNETRVIPLYTSPQPRDWVGLSDLDIADAYYKAMNQTIRQSDKLGVSKVAKAIEAKCKQLNTKG